MTYMSRADAMKYQALLIADIALAEKRLRAAVSDDECKREQLHLQNRRAFYETLQRALEPSESAVVA